MTLLCSLMLLPWCFDFAIHSILFVHRNLGLFSIPPSTLKLLMLFSHSMRHSSSECLLRERLRGRRMASCAPSQDGSNLASQLRQSCWHRCIWHLWHVNLGLVLLLEFSITCQHQYGDALHDRRVLIHLRKVYLYFNLVPSTGDQTLWLITTRGTILDGGWYENRDRNIIKSSYSRTPCTCAYKHAFVVQLSSIEP